MSKILKLSFDTDETVKTLSISNPREDITNDDAKAAMEAVVESGAFEGIIAPVKAVLYESDSTVIYEA